MGALSLLIYLFKTLFDIISRYPYKIVRPFGSMVMSFTDKKIPGSISWSTLRFLIYLLFFTPLFGDYYPFRNHRLFQCPLSHLISLISFSWTILMLPLEFSFFHLLQKFFPLLSYFIAKQPLKNFDRPLMRVSLSNSILVTLIFDQRQSDG